MDLTDDLKTLLKQRAICFIATTMPDGSPQLTETWADTDGTHVLINTVEGFVKVRNVTRDPRVAVAIADPANPFRYLQVRGRVVEQTTEGGAEHLEVLAQGYLGRSYPGFGDGERQVRVILKIEADSISGQG